MEYYLTASGDKVYRKDHPPGKRGNYEFSLFKAYWDKVWQCGVDEILEKQCARKKR